MRAVKAAPKRAPRAGSVANVGKPTRLKAERRFAWQDAYIAKGEHREPLTVLPEKGRSFCKSDYLTFTDFINEGDGVRTFVPGKGMTVQIDPEVRTHLVFTQASGPGDVTIINKSKGRTTVSFAGSNNFER